MDEPQFAGHPLSFYDRFPDESSLTSLEGVGEATASHIIAARKKRDRGK